ncbi:MAG: hypothetical protein EXR43_01535 [Dehalococcoidia bacterium]|nr:hypothetical protein [Dehalococcoidia bacterium]
MIARGTRPTDLLALVSFDGRVFRNEAVTWDRLSRAHQPPRAIESALDGVLSFATGKHSWISVEGQRIRALVSGRKRTAAAAWEVDTLLATDDELAAAPDLLAQLAEEACRAGAERVFLRLMEDSPALRAAEHAGFIPYRKERVYMRAVPPAGWLAEEAAPAGLRPRRDHDTGALFRLYCASTPEAERALEAATLNQWHAARERDGCRDHGEFVVEERDGRLSGWIRVARDGRVSRMMVIALQPECCVSAEAALAASLLRPGRRDLPGPVIMMVPERVGGVAPALESLGFTHEQTYVVLVQRLAQTVPVPVRRLSFVPTRQGKTVPAGPPFSTAVH